jgi:hypothetical protein
MKQANPSLLSRISLAFGSFFSILADGQFAARVQALRAGEQRAEPSAPAPAAAKPSAPPLVEAAPDGALQLLGLLQREARLIDFIQEDIAAYADADVGAAARVVHEGCRKVLHDNFTIGPVRTKPRAAASRCRQASMRRRSASPATSSASRRSTAASPTVAGA